MTLTNYLYRADGLKLQKRFGTKQVDYVDGLQYQDGVLQFVPTSQGYYDWQNKRYVYHYKDHLGNVRLSFGKDASQSREILSESNYYPFGLKHEGYNGVKTDNETYKYQFNGKEEQETGHYDFGARNYDPAIGRWFNLDPLAEKTMQPYSAFNNNPVMFTDPTGMEAEGLDELKDWYKNLETKNLEYFQGSGEIKGYEHIGESIRDGDLHYAADGKVYDDSFIGQGRPGLGERNLPELAIQKKYSMASKAWNSDVARALIPDVYTIGLTANAAAWIGTGTTPINFSLITRGKEPGIYYTPTINASGGTGGEANAGIAISTARYTRNPRRITSDMLQGHTLGGSAGVGLGPNASVNAFYAPVDPEKPIGKDGGFFGAGAFIGLGIEGSPAIINYQLNYQYTPLVSPIIKF
jgi:RHS repeat-associated protein